MKRLAAIVAACVMAAAAVLGASWITEQLMLLWIRHPIPRWIVPSASSIFILVGGIVIMMAGRKRKKAEEERLTPLVRRDPRTGLRQL